MTTHDPNVTEPVFVASVFGDADFVEPVFGDTDCVEPVRVESSPIDPPFSLRESDLLAFNVSFACSVVAVSRRKTLLRCSMCTRRTQHGIEQGEGGRA